MPKSLIPFPESAPTESAIRRALRRARDGQPLNVTEAAVLLAARESHLDQLLQTASRVRDAGLTAAGRPKVITYSRKVFIPLSRLCRDRCHYCTFATVPGRVSAPYLDREEVLDIARQGAGLGCKEALFTLGDRPEERWPVAKEWLASRGYSSTVEYLRACAIAVLEETGLLPHLNPGWLSWVELQRLKPVAPSMGMMLETTARRLWAEPGGCHYGSPDKEPARRLQMLTDAGRLAIPFTTGILAGIGETRTERVESLFAIRRIATEYRGVQEVIVQNFRAKPDTAMKNANDLDLPEYLATIAVARLVLGPGIRIQAPPNLVDLVECVRLLRAGIDDWGGVSPLTPDHVNPERPWPQIQALTDVTAQAGFALCERLTVYPSYVKAETPWIDPRVQPHVRALADSQGLAVPDGRPVGISWQEPDSDWASSGRVNLATDIDDSGRHSDRRGDFTDVYGDWTEIARRADAVRKAFIVPTVTSGSPARIAPELISALHRAEADPAGLSESDALALFHCDDEALDALCRLADDIRKDVVGDDVTYVVNRNINFTNVCYTGCRFCAFAQRASDSDAYTLSLQEVGERAAKAWEIGATEVCMQGGIHPDMPGHAYFGLAAEVKRRAPQIHIHAFSPMEVINGSVRTGLSIRDWLIKAKESGLDTIPGTAAEILDDDVRWILTKGKLPTASWIEVITTAHQLGIRSSATMMYGHVDEPRHWLTHLRLLARLQDETGGFTEFVALPFMHRNAPIYLAGVARSGPTERENRVVHAMARLLLHGRIENVQTSWVKLGVAGTRRMLQSGANDLGGTLMEETISRMAGSEFGSAKSVSELIDIPAGIGRSARQRTTTYGELPHAMPAEAPASGCLR